MLIGVVAATDLLIGALALSNNWSVLAVVGVSWTPALAGWLLFGRWMRLSRDEASVRKAGAHPD